MPEPHRYPSNLSHANKTGQAARLATRMGRSLESSPGRMWPWSNRLTMARPSASTIHNKVESQQQKTNAATVHRAGSYVLKIFFLV